MDLCHQHAWATNSALSSLTTKAEALERRTNNPANFELRLTQSQSKEKVQLLVKGFTDLSCKDYWAFDAALEQRSRLDIVGIVNNVSCKCSKDKAEVKRSTRPFEPTTKASRTGDTSLSLWRRASGKYTAHNSSRRLWQRRWSGICERCAVHCLATTRKSINGPYRNNR